MKRPKSQPKEDIETRFAEIAEAYRRQQETLARQNEFLTNIMESLPHPFYVIDASDYTVKMANSSAAPSGVPPGATCFVLTHRLDEPCGGSEHVCPIETIKRTKQSLITEHIHYDTEGNLRNVEVHGHPILDENGDVVQVIEYTLDITERKRAEEKFLRAKQEWERTFDSVPDLIAILDTQHRVLRANREMARRLGVTPKECVGLHCYELVHGKNHPPVSCPHSQTLNDGLEHVAEVHEERFGADFLVTTTPLLDEKGVMIGTVHVARDITRRKRMENELRKSRDELELRVEERTAELRRSEAYLAEAQRLTHTGSWARSKTGEIVYLSEELFRIFGFDPQEGIPSRETMSRLVHPGDLDRVRANIEKSIREKVDILDEYRILLPGGTIKHIQVIRRPVLNDAGDVVQLVGTAIDITDRKRAEEERVSHLKFLECMDRINRAMQGTNDLDQVISNALNAMLSIFDSDRAFLDYPCDPDAASFEVVMERTRPEYPRPTGVIPTPPDTARNFRSYLASSGPVTLGPGCDYPLEVSHYGQKSQILIALYPKTGKPWLLGMHQCSYPRVWTRDEKKLLNEIARRMTDALTSLLAHRDLHESEERYRVILRTAMDGFFRTDIQGRILEVNETYCRMSGYSEQELLTMNVADISAVRTVEIIAADIRSFVEEGPQRFESVHRRKDGSLFDVEIGAQYQPIASGQAVVFVRDITERKRAEEALRQSEAYLAEAQRMSHTGCWALDMASGKVYSSEENSRIYGFDPQEGSATWEAALERVHPEDLDRVKECIEKSIREKVDTSNEHRIMLPDGTVKHIYATRRPVLNDAGEVVKLVGTLIDVTERKRAEESLRASEHKYRELVENANSIILRFNSRGDITFLNEFGQKFFGYQEDEILGRNVVGTLTPEIESTGRDLRPLMAKICENPTVFEQNINENMLRDGSRVWIAWTNKIAFDPEGKLTEVLSIGSDVTERKCAEEALRQSEAHLTEAQRLGHTGSWALDLASDKFIYASEECSRIYGFGPQELSPTQETVLRRIHPEDRNRLRANHEKSLREKVDTFEEFRIVLPDGTVKHLHSVRHPVLNEAGDVVKMVGTTMDITERKLAEEALQNLLADLESRVEERTKELSEANQSLQAANKELDSFTYSVAHDLRAPLRAIDGFSMMVLKGYADKLDDDGRRKLNVIRSNTQQMGRLIDDLLTFSRLGRKEMANASLDIEAIVRSAWRELSQVNPERRIQFSVQRLPHGMGDQTLVKEVVVNLLSNAIKFTKHRENAIVEVGACPEKETDVYFVKDNGVGFDMQYYDKLFGVFQRLHSADEFEGTGVGLAIVERIIGRHGGRVWAEGKEGEGATFYFTLPRRGDG